MCQCMNGYECPECMFPKKPHKHAELIKAWADGAKIQHFAPHLDMWADITAPAWNTSCDYRIKPEVKEDYRLVARVRPYNDQLQRHGLPENTGWDIAVVCDGETGGLKSVEII